MPTLRRFLLARATRISLIFVLLIGSALLSVPTFLTTLTTSNASGTLPHASQPLDVGTQPSNLSAFTTDEVAPLADAADVAVASQDKVVAIEGRLIDAEGGEVVAGATVTLDDQVSTLSDKDGYFSFNVAQLRQVGAPNASDKQPVQVAISANGRAPWSIKATYYAGDVLRLYPKLATSDKAAISIVAANSRTETGTLSFAKSLSPAAAGVETFAIAEMAAPSLAPPASIRVYRTATGVVEVVPFKKYVKHVLPHEWIPSWSPESLKAGAMAVKAYGWFWVSRGGKQIALGADVKDNTEDQVYDPNVSYASTDAAVEATFNYAITRNGALFQAQYCAGSYGPDPGGDCPWPAPYMTQWGSSYYADGGQSWVWILQFYYPGSALSPQPPGGSSGGPKPPTDGLAPTRQPTALPPTPAPAGYVVGQGANRADVFVEAYSRLGGASTLGKPTGSVRWWLPYSSEDNLLAQPFSGPQGQGRGKMWLVYNVLKSDAGTGHRAYVISGDLATAYAEHNPPGPEWVGAPVSDPYVSGLETGSLVSQGFSKGTLSVTGNTVQFAAWPQRVTGWKAEYFAGHQAPSPQLAPALTLPGWPTLITDLPSPDMDWARSESRPQSLGAGAGSWSAQFTREYELQGGTYDFTLSADSGARLWIDGLLAVNGWHWSGSQVERYNADLAGGAHTVRVQYYSLSSSARLQFSMAPRTAAPTAVPTVAAPPVAPPTSEGTAQLRAQVRWLGRSASPSDSWVQPVTLTLSLPGDPAIIIGAYAGVTDRNGVVLFDKLPQGSFDVHMKGPHSLQSAKANVILKGDGVADVDMKAQVEGDVDGDNCVTVNDFARVQAMLGASGDTPGFASADLNGDGEVSMSDISLLRSGFDQCGDISADESVYALSTQASPNLEPWLNPEGQSRSLSMTLVASKLVARPGEIFEVNVVAQTGAQPIDGASFKLVYDPARLAPIDALGQAAKGVEPGIALPAVMGNWVDAAGGSVGYSAGALQSELPQGELTIATLHFRVLPGSAGTTKVAFAPSPSPHQQLTNGGDNLLSNASDLTLMLSR